jgi:DNA-binding IclR family transcriptional regulator
MTSDNSQKRRVKTADTVFTIIETLREMDGATVSELASELDMAVSTIHNHLSTLEDREYVVREDSVFRLGLRFLAHGTYAKHKMDLPTVVRPSLDQLADQTGEVAWLMVEEHGFVIHLSKAMGESAVQTYGEVGKRAHMHQLAAGKAILAHLSEERIREIVDKHGLPKRTEHSIADLDELLDQLQTVRERGYAFNEEEVVEGLRSVGAPIVKENDVVGSISVSAPANRMIGDRYRKEIPELIMGTTNEIELKLSY